MQDRSRRIDLQSSALPLYVLTSPHLHPPPVSSLPPPPHAFLLNHPFLILSQYCMMISFSTAPARAPSVMQYKADTWDNNVCLFVTTQAHQLIVRSYVFVFIVTLKYLTKVTDIDEHFAI